MASLCIRARGIHLNRKADGVARSCARIQSRIPDDDVFRAANCIFTSFSCPRNRTNRNIIVNFVICFMYFSTV